MTTPCTTTTEGILNPSKPSTYYAMAEFYHDKLTQCLEAQGVELFWFPHHEDFLAAALMQVNIAQAQLDAALCGGNKHAGVYRAVLRHALGTYFACVQ